MTREKGLNRYTRLMADWSGKIIDPIAKRVRPAEEFSDEERRLFDAIFRRFTEITETVDNLDLCQLFISAPIPRRKGLKLDRYLGYHITFYLQEIYILNERLESYAKTIMRLKKRGNRDREIAKRYEPMLDMVRTALSNIVKARGDHVHNRPFTDTELDELSTYSLLAQFKPEFNDHARFQYRMARTVWVKRLKENRAAIQTLLDGYFDFIYREVTDGLVPAAA